MTSVSLALLGCLVAVFVVSIESKALNTFSVDSGVAAAQPTGSSQLAGNPANPQFMYQPQADQPEAKNDKDRKEENSPVHYPWGYPYPGYPWHYGQYPAGHYPAQYPHYPYPYQYPQHVQHPVVQHPVVQHPVVQHPVAHHPYQYPCNYPWCSGSSWYGYPGYGVPAAHVEKSHEKDHDDNKSEDNEEKKSKTPH